MKISFVVGDSGNHDKAKMSALGGVARRAFEARQTLDESLEAKVIFGLSF